MREEVDLSGMAVFVRIVENGSLNAAGRDLGLPKATVSRRLRLLAASVGAPLLTRIHRWPRGMPQYVLGHPERVERIEAAVAAHPGLALAGAAYRGVGIPDCILSGEDAAGAVASALERVPG